MIIHYEHKVKEFMDAFDQKRYDMLHNVPHKVLLFRRDLINEELKEYEVANSKLEQLDALCDLMYVIVGTSLTTGIQISPVISDDAFPWWTDYVIEELSLSVPCSKRLRTYINNAVGEIEIKAGHDFDFTAAFDAVHANNMDKLWTQRPVDTELIVIPKGDKFLVKRADGKVIKPANHSKVDLTAYVK